MRGVAELNYYDTLIAVAEDCPVTSSVVPKPRAGRPTVAVVQHELLAVAGHGLTQEDVLFLSWLRRQPEPERLDEAAERHRFFSRSQACLRASPLPKQYGFGLLFDAGGVVSLCPMESAAYGRALASGEVTVVRAMRSRRAAR